MLALFDIDGTLIRTGGSGSKALARAFEQVHGLVDALAGMRLGGKTDPLIVDEIFHAHHGRPATSAEFAAVIEVYLGHLETEIARCELYRVLPGADAAVSACLAHGATVGLATGNVERAARVKLERGGLWARFSFGGYGSDAGERALLVERAIERGERHAGRRFERRDVLVIGDTVRDIAAARANGAVALAVATGGEDVATLAAAGADEVFETLEALPAWLVRAA